MFGFMMVSSGAIPPPPSFVAGFAYVPAGGFGSLTVDKWDFTAGTDSVITDTLTYGPSDQGGFGNLTEGLWAGGQDFDGFNSRNPTDWVDKITYATDVIIPGTVLPTPDYGFGTGCSNSTTGVMNNWLYTYSTQTWAVGGASGSCAGNETKAVILQNSRTTIEYTYATNTSVAGHTLSTWTNGSAFSDANYAVFAEANTYTYTIEAYVFSVGTFSTLQSFGSETGGVFPARQHGAAANGAVGGIFGGHIFTGDTNRVVYYDFANFLLSTQANTLSAGGDWTTVALASNPGGLQDAQYAAVSGSSAGTQFINDQRAGDGYADFCNIELPSTAFEANGYFMICEVEFDLQDAGGPPLYPPLNASGYTITTPPGWTLIRRDNQAHCCSVMYYRFSNDEPTDTAPFTTPQGAGAGGGGVSYYVLTNMPYNVYANSMVCLYTNVDPNDPIFAHSGIGDLANVFNDTLTLGVNVADPWDRVVFGAATLITSDVNDDYPTSQLEGPGHNGPNAIMDTQAHASGVLTRTASFATNIGDPIILQAASLNRGYSPLGTVFPVITFGGDTVFNGVTFGVPAYAQANNGIFMLAVIGFNTQVNADPASNYSTTVPAGWNLIRRDNNGQIAVLTMYRFSNNEPTSYTVVNNFPGDGFGGITDSVYTAAVLGYQGVDTVGTIISHGASTIGYPNPGPNLSVDCPSRSGGTAGDLLICIPACDDTIGGIINAPASMRKRAGNGNNITVYDETITSSPTGIRTFEGSTTVDFELIGVSILVKKL